MESGPPGLNSYAELADRDPPVGTLSIDTNGHQDRCRRRHRELVLPRFGFTDELPSLSRAGT